MKKIAIRKAGAVRLTTRSGSSYCQGVIIVF